MVGTHPEPRHQLPKLAAYNYQLNNKAWLYKYKDNDSTIVLRKKQLL